MSTSWSLTFLFIAVGAVAPAVRGQGPCAEPEGYPFDVMTAAYPGANGQVRGTTLWDPDGPGPKSAVLVVAGDFSIIADIQANKIAVFDPATGVWSTLGDGLEGSIHALAGAPDGTLIVGGGLKWSGSTEFNAIATWTPSPGGGAWSTLGSGIKGGVYALAVLPSGDVVAGGQFGTAGGIAVSNIARWDGAAWSPMGLGMNYPVTALAPLGDGTVVAGGNFTSAGGKSVNHIARWSGSGTGTWEPMGLGVYGSSPSDAWVSALVPLANGDVIVGGKFTVAGDQVTSNIARWTPLGGGGKWSTIGEGFNSVVYTIARGPNSEVVAGGVFTASGSVPAASIARWDGNAWSALAPDLAGGPGGSPMVHTVSILQNGDVIAGGQFFEAGGAPVEGLARWSDRSGGRWRAIANGLDDGILAMARLESGDLVIAGSFSAVGALEARSIARWTAKGASGSWSPVGEGTDGPVNAVAPLPGDGLVAGGSFKTAGNSAVSNIARWDPAIRDWVPMGKGVNNTVYCLASRDDGDVIAGGIFSTAGNTPSSRISLWRFTTGEWSALGSGLGGGPTQPPTVHAVAWLPDGGLIAGGTFANAGGATANRFARWHPTSGWTNMGTGMDYSVHSLLVLPDADILVGGFFTTVNGISAKNIARWDAGEGEWLALGEGVGGFVNAMHLGPTGDLIVGGNFILAGGQSAPYLARWDGSAWSGFGPDVGGAIEPFVTSLVALPDGDLAVGGHFVTIGEQTVGPSLARFRCPPPCVADCDASGALSIDDFVCFQTVFVLGEAQADCDGNGTLSIDDFVCFQAHFAMGC